MKNIFKDKLVKTPNIEPVRGFVDKAKTATLDPASVVGALAAKATHGVTGAAKKLLNVVKIASAVKDTVISLRMFLLSLLILVLVIGVFALVYVLARVIHIRGFRIGHMEDIESFMKAFHDDVNTTRKLYTSIQNVKDAFDTGKGNLIDILGCDKTLAYFSSMEASVEQEVLDTYFKYHDVINSSGIKSWYEKDLDRLKSSISSKKTQPLYNFAGSILNSGIEHFSQVPNKGTFIQKVFDTKASTVNKTKTGTNESSISLSSSSVNAMKGLTGGAMGFVAGNALASSSSGSKPSSYLMQQSSTIFTNLESDEYIRKVVINPFDYVRSEVKHIVRDRDKLESVQRILFLCSSVSEDDFNNDKIQSISNQEAVQMAKHVVASCKKNGISYSNFKSYMRTIIDLCVGLNILNLYMNVYYDDIKRIHNNRRFGFFNLLIMLIIPYFNTLIKENVIEPWKELLSADGTKKDYKKFMKSWDSLGDTLANLPRTLASSKKKSSDESFTENKKDIIEGFSFLKGLLSIGNFFEAILDLALGIAELLSNPLEMLLTIFKLVIGLIVGLILLILYTLISLPPFIYIVYAIYFFVVTIVINAVFSLFWVALFALFSIISAVIWTVDLLLSSMSGFKRHSFLVSLAQCENLPDMWYTRANYVDGNMYNRAFLCQTPCSSRFKPAGVFCTKGNNRQPSYCPQAQAYRIYKGLPLKPNPYSMDAFTPDISFYTKSSEMKKQTIKKYFEEKQDYLQKCSKINEPYDILVKNICANYDTIKIPDEKLRPALQTVCRQAYCDGNPKEDFCYKFSEKQLLMKPKVNAVTSDDVIKRVMNLLVLIIISVIVLLMFLHNA